MPNVSPAYTHASARETAEACGLFTCITDRRIYRRPDVAPSPLPLCPPSSSSSVQRHAHCCGCPLHRREALRVSGSCFRTAAAKETVPAGQRLALECTLRIPQRVDLCPSLALAQRKDVLLTLRCEILQIGSC